MKTDSINQLRVPAVMIALILLTTVYLCPADERKSKIIDVGTHKQLLFDELFLDKSSGVKLRMNTPFQDPEPVLVADKPWEQRICGYHTVMFDDGRFRMWYDIINYDGNEQQKSRLLCYAESSDGISWVKPDVGVIEFNGSKRNNIVAPPSPNASQQGATVFRDDHAPPHERYKLWTKYEPSEQETAKGMNKGVYAMVSPDGLRWKMLGKDRGYPLQCGSAADSQNICFWDPDLDKYIAFVRMKRKGPEPRKRTCWVGLTTSKDFEHWKQAQDVFFADEQMPVPGGKPGHLPVVDLYVPGGMKVPGVPDAYILMPTPYYHWQTDEFPSTIDVALATSRDRVNWWRPAPEDREPFIRLGLAGSISSGMVRAFPWPIVVGDEVWIYHSGTSRTHNASVKQSKSAVFRARLRRNGFVSVDAAYRGGEFTTPVITFAGSRMELNLDGSAGGWLQVEIQSADGKLLSGYKLNDCDTIRGNSLAKPVTWQGKTDVSELAGKPVRLRFVLRSTKLYSFQFVE